MKSTVTEIAPDTYRISTFNDQFGLQFNQFLIKDTEPFLMHTGMKGIFSSVREAVRSVMDPAALRWIGWSHFESDECGALNEWLAVAIGRHKLRFLSTPHVPHSWDAGLFFDETERTLLC